jgi:predicted transcriptional regulator
VIEGRGSWPGWHSGGSGRIFISMTPATKTILEQVADWPQQDQDELAEYAREIEARRSGIYVLSDEEWADLQEGIAQADRGEFVPDEVVANADKRHGG